MSVGQRNVRAEVPRDVVYSLEFEPVILKPGYSPRVRDGK